MVRGLLLGGGAVGGLAVLVVLGVVLYGMIKYLSIARIGDLPVDAVNGGQPVNFLIVGSDEREGADEHDTPGHRSDVVMVARLDQESGEISVLSIPRDLVLPIAGTGTEARINQAYATDRTTLIETVRAEFNIEVHHYVELDFSGFQDLVDEVGGVDIWVDAAIKDDRTGLFVDELGCVELDGEQALAFVRSRHLQYMTPSGWSAPDPSADLGRTERQQVFMARALAEVAAQVRDDPTRLPALVDVGVGAVTIDDQLSMRNLMDVAGALSGIEPQDLRTYSLPVVSRGDGATLAVDGDRAGPVLDHFRAGDTGAGDTGGGTGRSGDGDGDSSSGGAGEGDGTGPSDDAAAGSEEAAPGRDDHRPEETSNLVTEEFVHGAAPGGGSC